METPRKHVIFISFPNISHITCLLHLARKVVRYHDVTFVASSVRVTHLREHGIFSEADEKAICLVALNDSITVEEVSDKNLGGKNGVFFKYPEALEKLIVSLPVKGAAGISKHAQPVDRPITTPIDVYVTDIVVAIHAGPILDRGVPVIVFVASAGFVFSNKINIDKDTPLLEDQMFFSDWEAHPDISRTGAPGKFKENMMEFHGSSGVATRLHAVVLNSIAELEPECVQLLQAHQIFSKKPMRFVAPLFDLKATAVDSRIEAVVKWLDSHEDRSVVYVSFGTMAVSKQEQVQEIAKALLSLKKPFIWGLRQEEHQFLPNEMRTGSDPDSNFLILPWTPQKAILNHKSTAVFLSHAGWNSYLESMDCGVPMVAWPLFGDHFGIANMLVEAGGGIKIPGTSMRFEKLILAETIVDGILTVGEWQDGPKPTGHFRNCAQKVGQLIKNATESGGSSDRAFMDLVQIDIGNSSTKKNATRH